MICGSVRKLEEDEGDEEEVGAPKTSEKSKSGSVEDEEESGILRWVSLFANME